MLDMSSSMPIFTTPLEIFSFSFSFSWAGTANGHPSSSTAPVAIAADLFMVTSRLSASRQSERDDFSSNRHLALFSDHALIVPLFPQQRLGHFAQAHLLHFWAIRAVDGRERVYHHNPLRDLESRQLFQAARPQACLVHLSPGSWLNKSHRHRISRPSRSRHDLHGRHAG